MTLPLIMTQAGPQPTPVTTLQQALIQSVSSQVPGYTANLPGSLIEDISSTDVAALAVVDQARVDAVNSVSPYGANASVLLQLGQQFGLTPALPTNGSVDVQFSGTVGYAVPAGFVVSDGTTQFQTTVGTVVGTNGTSALVSAQATSPAPYAIAAGTVTTVVSSVASGDTLTVTNPQAGTSATDAETIPAFRTRIMTAFDSTVRGTPSYLKSLLYAISGVTPQLVAVNSTPNGWQVVCGGGDSYATAFAILSGVADISGLVGSQLAITGMTAANPVVVTTNLDSNLAVGSTFTVAGASPSAYNVTYTVASVSGTKITTTTNGSAFGTYTSGATFDPNPRNVTVSIFQDPDTYSITYVDPPQQATAIAITWNTQLAGFANGASVAASGSQAVQSYINQIGVGQPINILELQQQFTAAVAQFIDASNITSFAVTVTIDGVVTPPSAGTNIVPSDPESYFYCAANGVTVTQG